jgi:hypothetical protein
VDTKHDVQAICFELGAGPVVADINIIVGPGAGSSAGVVAQDHSDANLGHNLIVKFSGPAVDLHGLTGRENSPMKDWWIGGNMMLSGDKGPWLHIHDEKVLGGKEAIQNETAQHNLITGGNASYPAEPLNITVGPNENDTASSFTVQVDRDEMVLSIQGDAVLDLTACRVGGPGGDRDFTGAKRSGSKCVPGPLADLQSGHRLNVSRWPTGGLWF